MNEMLFVLDTSPALHGLALNPMGAGWWGGGGGGGRRTTPSAFMLWRLEMSACLMDH